MKKIICILMLFCAFSHANYANKQEQVEKFVYIEALYGFGGMIKPYDIYLHDVQARIFFPTTGAMHELLARGSFSQDKQKSGIKHNGWEAEYRIGMRLDEHFKSLGTMLGSAYIGLGYQNLSHNTGGAMKNLHLIYFPLGAWGEESLGEGAIMSMMRLRWGLNTKMIFLNNYNSEGKLKGNFLFGLKVHLGVGVKIMQSADIFAQGFFQWNLPLKKTQVWGLEVGMQF
ncbi:hypothetical protein [Helicobacter sp. 23-1045]